MSYVDCCGWSECNQCGTCLIKCPVMRMKKDEANSKTILRKLPLLFKKVDAHLPRIPVE